MGQEAETEKAGDLPKPRLPRRRAWPAPIPHPSLPPRPLRALLLRPLCVCFAVSCLLIWGLTPLTWMQAL